MNFTTRKTTTSLLSIIDGGKHHNLVDGGRKKKVKTYQTSTDYNLWAENNLAASIFQLYPQALASVL